ncbi:MAG: hypothetical protein IBX55_17100 [Methyloprofundus sp.]|nr:hypothetical protein [Methyloprofundus sp.]
MTVGLITPFSSEVEFMVGAEKYDALTDAEKVAVYAAYKIVQGVVLRGDRLFAFDKENLSNIAMEVLSHASLHLNKTDLTVRDQNGNILGKIPSPYPEQDMAPRDVFPITFNDRGVK